MIGKLFGIAAFLLVIVSAMGTYEYLQPVRTALFVAVVFLGFVWLGKWAFRRRNEGKDTFKPPIFKGI